MALKGIRLRAASYVDRIELVCQDVRSPGRMHQTTLTRAGSSSSFRYLEQCQSESFLTRLHTNSGQFVDRVGGLCEAVAHVGNAQSNAVLRAGTELHVLPSHGGRGGFAAAASDACPAGHAMVGVRTYHENGAIAGIQARCADAQGWSSLTTTNTNRRTLRGRITSDLQDRTCVQGQFVVGMFVDTDNLVHGVQLVCRSFGG
jgi:hypothetical protein